MKIRFYNEWIGNSMKNGGAFPITIFEIFIEIHPTYKVLIATVLNFRIEIDFKKGKINEGIK